MHRYVLVAAALAAVAGPALAPAQERQRDADAFKWSGRIPEGRWLRVKSLNGPIRVEPGDGPEVEVRGEKSWRRGDPKDVRFEVIRDGESVTICALWFETSRCDAEGYHSHSDGRHSRNNDVNVEFTVRLPRGVKVDVGTVNGAVDVTGARAEVVAHTVNGRVDASTTSGPVDAGTVNGAVHVRMDELAGSADMDFSTVNGSVTVEVPSRFDAELEMSTVNGTLRTDFPITVSGRFNPRHFRAAIGSGGRRVRLSTVNGSIELRKIQ